MLFPSFNGIWHLELGTEWVLSGIVSTAVCYDELAEGLEEGAPTVYKEFEIRSKCMGPAGSYRALKNVDEKMLTPRSAVVEKLKIFHIELVR